MIVFNKLVFVTRTLCGKCMHQSHQSLVALSRSSVVYSVTEFNKKHYATSMFSRTLSHSDRKVVSVPVEVMYDVVADVSSYKEFVPWCTKSVVTSQTKKTARAKLAVGFGPVQEYYNSTLIYNKPRFIQSVCTDGKLFNLLDCTWRFSNGPSLSNCVIKFDVTFEFRSLMYSRLAKMFFNEVVKKMVMSFETRALQKHKQMLLRQKKIDK